MAKTKRHRSPGYPAINLRAAIKLAEKIYPGAGKHPLGGDVIAKEWNYKGVSSAAPYIAALKYYGLLVEEKGEGNDRMLRLSARATDILVDPDGESRERAIAIKEAALAPTLHKELWDRWGGDVPPEGEIRRHLVRDRSFNPNRVDTPIEVFKDTIEFAKLAADDILDHSTGAEDNHIGDSAMDTSANETGPSSAGVSLLPVTPAVGEMRADFKRDVFTLDEGPVIIQWPERLSPASLEDFEAWLQLIVRRARRSVPGTAEDDK